MSSDASAGSGLDVAFDQDHLYLRDHPEANDNYLLNFLTGTL